MTQNQQNKTCEASLLPLRQDIDKIDDQIISLLKDRMEVVTKVGELKKNSQEKFFIRSNREADMIKNLIEKSKNFLSSETIISIWRKIITAANMREQSLRIAIHNPHDVVDYTYLVREYYSNCVPMHNFDSVNNVVLALEKSEAQIAVFALPKNNFDLKVEDAAENWWIALANNRNGLRVFAKIPFAKFLDEKTQNNQIELVAVAAKNPEKSSDDNSLFYAEVSHEISKTQVLAAFKEQGLVAKILKSVKLHQVDGMVFYLIEVVGFWLEEDEVIKNFSKSKAKAYVKILGHYARGV
jgi:chorismate mutase